MCGVVKVQPPGRVGSDAGENVAHGHGVGDVERLFTILPAITRIERDVQSIECDEFMGPRKRQRPKQRGVDGAEHRGRRPNTECEDAHHRRRESRALAEAAYCITSILPEGIGSTKAPRIATPLGHLDGVSEATPGFLFRFRASEPFQGLRAELAVQRHLVLEFTRRLFFIEEQGQSTEQRAHRQVPRGVMSRMAAMAWLTRPYDFRARSSCFLPDAVMR